MKTDTQTVQGDMRWSGYLTAIGLGGSFKAGCARLCKQLKCETAGQARRKVEHMLVAGTIDGQGYQTYMEAIETIEAMYHKGEQTHVVSTNPGDWDALPSGGHVRKNHIH